MNVNAEKEYWQRAIREVLDASGLTMEELAERVGVSVRAVAEWKRGHRPTGMAAVRFFEFRRDILTKNIVMACESTVG